MIFDLASSGAPEHRHYDVAIVGGGTVAIYLASKLAASGLRTLVLESGGHGFEAESQALNTATQSGRRHEGICDARARMLGGTSNLWGGQLTPFVASDFLARPGIAEAPWPLGLDELTEHYASVATDLGLGDSLDAGCQQAKQLFTSGFPEFHGIELFYTRWLREPRLTRLFGRTLETSPNIDVWLHAHVVDLNLNASGDRIESIAVDHSNGRIFQVQADTIILANGTVEIARLLLAAAARNCRAPWATNRWLGVAFQDHLDMRVARVRMEKGAELLVQNIVVGGNKYQPKFRWSDSAIRFNGLNVACSFAFESSVAEHLQYLKVMVRSVLNGRVPKGTGSILRHLRGVGGVWWPMVRHYLKHHRIHSPADRGTWLLVHCEQAPLQSSRITLSSDKTDRYGMPLADLNWDVEGCSEVEAIAAFVEQLQSALAPHGLHVDPLPRLLTRDVSILETARDSYHQCGGTRMGHDAEDGVVDRDLRVFGTDNLYVAGAASFRTSSYANPTFTALALASRLAAHLKHARQVCK